jgi:hypothetical protein
VFSRRKELSKKNSILILVLAMIAGFIGGALSNRFLLVGIGQTQEDLRPTRVVVANEFHLVDTEEKDRWVLALSEEDEPNITFVNKNGWAPMAIGLNKHGVPFFNMFLEPSKAKGPSLVMMDSQGRNRALFGLREDGEPHITFLDGNGQMRAVLGSVGFESNLTGLKETRSRSSLVLFDERGKIIRSAPQVSALPVQYVKSTK